MKAKKGFTLIELLIVIAVIGILASAVLVGLGPVQRSGRDARRASDLRQTQNALELYSNRYGCYPYTGTAGPCVPPGAPGTLPWGAGGGPACGAGSGLTQALTGGTPPVVAVVPNDPRVGSCYSYGFSQGATGYVIQAVLEDPESPLRNSDVDGTVYGIDCADSAGPGSQTRYCVQL